MVVGQMFVVWLQLTSHWHELAQLIEPHAGSVPVHVAVSLPVPALTVPHASRPPEQVSVQVPPPHCIVPHAALPLQLR